MSEAGELSGPILFYDGDCGLCDRLVRWCLKHDRRRVLWYAPLQGATYAALDVPDKPTSLDTVVCFDERGLHTRSDAVLRVMRHVGGVWGPLGAAGRVVPRAIRDRLYRFVAARRIRWFGGKEACRLPTAEERSRLLP